MQKSDLKKTNLPDVPGVYLFKQGRKILYVGKAASLRDRVRSYFDDDLIATRGPRVVDMVTRADRIAHEPTPTVLEALVREAALIKKYHPTANAEGKDDKTFLYVVITKEDIPRVLVMRGKDLFPTERQGDTSQQGVSLPRGVSLLHFRAIYGPFPSGAQLKEGLKLIRRIFPFFDTVKPVETKSKHHRAHIEFNTQIGQYPKNVRFTLESPIVQNKEHLKNYRKSIRKIMLFLSGRGKELRMTLEKEMKVAAKEERFEDAAKARRELFALNHIQDVSLIKDENLRSQQDPQGDTSRRGVTLRAQHLRIEAYDVAHLSGTNAIGVMTVLADGSPVKKEYRTFRIRGIMNDLGGRSLKNDDIASLKEVLSRRFGHPEWPFPKVIVVDGGKAQKKAAETVLTEAGLEIPVVAVVKDERHRPREVMGASRAGISESDAVLANSEAHRFSLAKHRAARSRNLRV